MFVYIQQNFTRTFNFFLHCRHLFNFMVVILKNCPCSLRLTARRIFLNRFLVLCVRKSRKYHWFFQYSFFAYVHWRGVTAQFFKTHEVLLPACIFSEHSTTWTEQFINYVLYCRVWIISSSIWKDIKFWERKMIQTKYLILSFLFCKQPCLLRFYPIKLLLSLLKTNPGKIFVIPIEIVHTFKLHTLFFYKNQ